MICGRQHSAQARELIVGYYSVHDTAGGGSRHWRWTVNRSRTQYRKHTKYHAKSDGFCLDMCACDSDLAGQDGLALENTNEAIQPKMARQRYDQQGAWASGKCMKYRRWTYRHNVFPCGCPAAHLLVSRLIASTRRRQGFSEPPVCDTVFASLSVPCADLLFTRWRRTFGNSTEGLRLPLGFLALCICTTSIDLQDLAGYYSVLAVWEHLPKANFHL